MAIIFWLLRLEKQNPQMYFPPTNTDCLFKYNDSQSSCMKLTQLIVPLPAYSKMYKSAGTVRHSTHYNKVVLDCKQKSSKDREV